MQYCTRCLYPANHPLNITFDEAGVCSGCRVHEEKDQLDWRARRETLQRIVSGYRSRTRPIHDCIVPVTGARDSFFIVHVLKNVLGMHPLLVNYNQHYNTPMGIRNLAYLRTLLGCDIITSTVSPERVKRITRESLKQRGSMYWHNLAGRTVFPVQIAVKFRIPLIVWGVHQGCDQVGMFSHTDEVEMARKYRKEHDLMGLEAEDLAAAASDVSLDDVEPYVYPHDKELEAVGVRGIYLSNYIRWDTKAQHERMIATYGYETAQQARTFDSYNDVDCFHYSGLHDRIKFNKCGYGRASDHASREIRFGRLTREQGIALVRRYRDVEPPDTALLLKWLDMPARELWAQVDAHRDERIWRRNRDPQRGHEWELRDCITNHDNDEGVDAARLQRNESDDCDFSIHSKVPASDDDGYILIGRGWVDPS